MKLSCLHAHVSINDCTATVVCRWKFDMTTGAASQVKDINPGTGSSSPAYLTNLNGVVYFGGAATTTNRELYRSDGTAAGTYMVKDIHSTSSSSPTYIIAGSSMLYFAAAAVFDIQL